MSREQADRILLLYAMGTLLSNAAFNLSQRGAGGTLDANDIASLADGYSRWDKANRVAWESGAMQALTEMPPEFDPIAMGA